MAAAVQRLRDQRAYCVTTKGQYRFIYKAVLEFVAKFLEGHGALKQKIGEVLAKD